MNQEYSKKSREQEEEITQFSPEKSEHIEKAIDHTDDLLDEIDDVLEENAEDFVKSYIQKGGQ